MSPSPPQPWTNAQLRFHKQAVNLLETILNQASTQIKKHSGITEERLWHFMVEKMRSAGLTSVLDWVIVAYGASAADPHYHFQTGKSRVIKPGHFLMLDIWGKLNRPEAIYADLTRTFFVGAYPSDHFQKLWNAVREARDKALTKLQNHSQTPGATLHQCAANHLASCGQAGLFIHGLGHDLGVDHPHGPGANLSPKHPTALIPGRGYTIEPGLYKKGVFGLRLEMDLYLTPQRKVQVTSTLDYTLPLLG